MAFGALAVTIIAAWLLGYFWDAGPGGSGVLASHRLADGSEYMITQRYSWPEGYIVDFYMRSAGGEWRWGYIDHEANRWRHVDISYDSTADKLLVTERGIPRAVLDRRRNTFWIDNGSVRREDPAPQRQRTPPFDFSAIKQRR